jgi:hypothetical protein
LDQKYLQRIKFPDGMVSGYYKYIVFEPIEKSTGKVYDNLCHTIMNHERTFPNAEWAAQVRTPALQSCMLRVASGKTQLTDCWSSHLTFQC